MRSLILLMLMLMILPKVAVATLDVDVEAELLMYNNQWDKGVGIVLYQSRQYGTGWWIDREEHILVTAAHVVSYNAEATQADINIIRGEFITRGRVIYLDRTSDIAIIQTEDIPEDAYIFSIARSVEKGENIIVIGYPYELLQVYANDLYRMSMNPRASFGQITWIEEPYRMAEIGTYTDAGNSGGPIVNERGAVVGLVTFALAGRSATLYFMTTTHAIREALDRAGVQYTLAPESMAEAVSDITSTGRTQLVLLAVGAFAIGILVATFVKNGRR